ncbi:guanine deaminase [Pseudaeromonas paramecii]|uniref:Guanine deaminase n=2 Tax=Pseudaeromonas paramecii TaxID=2138166 RepID=A0ABP8PX26_9GAMM
MKRMFLVLLSLLSLGACMSVTAQPHAYRGSLLHFTDDPTRDPAAQHYLDDGLLIIADGKVVGAKPFAEASAAELALPRTDYRGKLLLPGFIDTHIHFPQTEMVAAYGEQLLEWLNTYTFPTERKFADPDYAARRASFFIDELLRNGTTTALVFATVHPASVDALFAAADAKRMRLIAGKVLMDRNAPDYLTDTAESGYRQSQALIAKWHHHNRLLYAVTPRFAPTSSPDQLAAAGKLFHETPELYLHTHLSENQNEIAWVKSLFPEREGYLDVYDHYGLTGPRAVFAHGIHLEAKEQQTLADSGSAVAFCPTSNLFLGSGLFRLHPLKTAGVRVGLGTDIGAGTSFSLLQTLNEGYKVQQLQGEKLSAAEGLYQATLGGARALYLEDKLGNFLPGKEADFVVLDWAATPLQQLRQENSRDLADRLFALMMLGDERNVAATYVDGRQVFGPAPR